MVIQTELFSDARMDALLGLADSRALVLEAVMDALRPDPMDTVDEWSDKHRYLDTSTSAEPGLYKTDRVPYTREIMRALSPHDPCTHVVCMKGAQLGLTEVGNNWVGCIIHRYPSAVVMVMPTLALAKRTARTRIDKMVSTCPELKSRVSSKRSKEGGNTSSEKEFPGGLLVITGANSSAGLRSTPSKFVFLDEIDAYPVDCEGEGCPVKLAERGARTFSRKKIFKISTPTFARRSRIAAAFEQSDRSYYFIPCPRCDHFQKLIWRQLKFKKEIVGNEDRVVSGSVYYECEECEEPFYEYEKSTFLGRGVWRAEVPELTTKVRGFHISALYSPLGWRNWEEIIGDFLLAQGNPELLRVWTNHDLGECWDERGAPPDWELLYNRRENYKVGVVPERACLITAGVDVQGDRIEYFVHAWAPNMESWGIDKGILVGDPEKGEVFNDLDDVLSRTYPHASSGLMIPIRRLAIDSGFATQAVYAWASKHSRRQVLVIKGKDPAAVLIGTPTAVQIKSSGKRYRSGLQLYTIGVGLAKSEFYGWLRNGQPTNPEETGYPRGFVHFPEWDEEYFRQITAEQLVPRVRRGPGGNEIGRRYLWEKTRPRNEALDGFVYARAALATIGADRWTNARWEREAIEVGSGVVLAGDQGTQKAPAKKSTPPSRFSRWRD